MRFVPIKSEDAQAMLTLHRGRRGFIEDRTATVRRIRGLLSELGVVLPRTTNVVRAVRAKHSKHCRSGQHAPLPIFSII
jgi:transposase